MTIKSIIELLAQADANLPDNSAQLISAADVRVLIKDFVDTMSPAYGVIQLVSSNFALVPTPPVKLTPFTNNLQQTAGYFVNSVANANVRRLISGVVAGATNFVVASGGVSGANNSNVTVTLYKNGVATPYSASVTCSGVGDVVGFNIAAIDYTATDDAEYDLRAAAPAGNYTFTNVVLLAQAQPVRTFV